MIRGLAILSLVVGTPLSAQTDSPWLNWVSANSPHGFDVTNDGTIWINIAETGRIDDYAIRAEDLQQARESDATEHTFWVRGYHLRNTKVTYRESRTRATVNCEQETFSISSATFYDKDGNLVSKSGYSSPEYIVPGTYGAEIYRSFCLF